MKDNLHQKRQFILSSFARLKITFNTSVYRFADKIIRENWNAPLTSLDDVDREIKQMYDEFLQNG